MSFVFRQFHRWVGTVVAVFLLVIAASGVTLQIEMMLTQPGEGAPGSGGGQPGADGAPATYTDAQLLDMVRTTLAAAHRADPSSPPMQVQLELGPHPVGTVTLMAATPQRHGFNALTGQVVGGGDQGARSLHLFLLRLHRGDLIGKPGLWLSIACGTSLFVLCLTGAWVYMICCVADGGAAWPGSSGNSVTRDRSHATPLALFISSLATWIVRDDAPLFADVGAQSICRDSGREAV